MKDIEDSIMSLPEPVAVYTIENTLFEIFRAKDLDKKNWSDRNLEKLVKSARLSYLRYGDRPLLDPYDSKSAIYITKASYQRNGKKIEEWMSGRVTPGSGNPVGVNEPELYEFQGKKLDFWISRKLHVPYKEIWRNIYSTSRMCAISPYIVNDDNSIQPLSKTKLKYTPIFFALIYRQFYIDYPERILDGNCITGIIRDDLVQNALVIKRNNQLFLPHFTPAHIFLGLRKNMILLDRQEYAYLYPKYWLNMEDLKELLGQMVESGTITRKTIKFYTGSSLKSKKGLKNLGNLLAVRGQLHDATITGEELRQQIDRDVRDGVDLKITKSSVWLESLEDILKAVKCRSLANHILETKNRKVLIK
jgi:hypothetical protein